MSNPAGQSGIGAMSTVCSWLEGKPFRTVILAAVVSVCAYNYAVAPATKSCDGDIVKVAADNSVTWATPKGEVGVIIGDAKVPKEVCIVELTKDEAAGSLASLEFTKDLWAKEHGIN